MKKFEDCEGLFIRYKSNTTEADGGTAWQGKVYSVEPDEDGEVSINGTSHNAKSIEVLEIIYFEE